jgi:hypothetical protein
MAEKKENLGNVVLMLTTVDRANRKPVVSVVQYEEVKGEYYLTAPRSSPAEWIRNIHTNPWVDAQVKGKKVHALMEPVIDTPRIADFLEAQLARNSPPTQALLRSHGLPKKPSRAQLEALAGRLSLFVLHPAKW